MCFISFSNMFQVFTGKLVAFTAELNFVVHKQLATFLKKRTILVSRSATFAVRQFDSFSFNIVF